MSSENELAVWDIYGQKRWEYFVEPPWKYTIEDDIVFVHIDGKQTALNCEHGVVIEGTTVQS